MRPKQQCNLVCLLWELESSNIRHPPVCHDVLRCAVVNCCPMMMMVIMVLVYFYCVRRLLLLVQAALLGSSWRTTHE